MSDQQFNDEPIAMTYIVPPTDEPWGDILHPVTIFQILQAESSDDNSLIMEGKEFTTVKLVAHVVTVDVSSSGVTYTLEDGTGKIYASKDLTCLTFHQLAEAEERERVQCEAFEHTFVEVTAILKRDRLKWKRIKVISICPVHDYSQVMYHILDVMQRDKLLQQCIQPDEPGQNFGSSEDMQDKSTDVALHPILSNTFSPQRHHPHATLKPVERAIMKHMYRCRNQHILIAELAQVVQESCGCTESQFRLAVQMLLSEAYITSPLDDGYVVITPRH